MSHRTVNNQARLLSCCASTWHDFTAHVKRVPCHHDNAYPQVADAGNCFKMWRVAAKIMNKQSQTDDKRWPSSLRVGHGGLATFTKTSRYEMLHSDIHSSGSCVHGNKYSSSVNGGVFPDQLSDYWFLTKDITSLHLFQVSLCLWFHFACLYFG
jgi:hypothetical protein